MSQERELLREALPCLESAFRIVTMGDGYPSAVEKDNTGLINRIRALLDEPEPVARVWRIVTSGGDVEFTSESVALTMREYGRPPYVERVESAPVGKWEVVE